MFRTESINQPGSHRSVILGAVLVLALGLAIVAVAGFALVKDAVRPGAGSVATDAATSESLRETWRGVYAGATTVNPAATSATESELQRETWRGWYTGAAASNPATTSESLRETWRGVYAGSSAGAAGAGPAANPQPGEDANGSSTSTDPLHRFGRPEPR